MEQKKKWVKQKHKNKSDTGSVGCDIMKKDKTRQDREQMKPKRQEWDEKKLKSGKKSKAVAAEQQSEFQSKGEGEGREKKKKQARGRPNLFSLWGVIIWQTLCVCEWAWG